MAIRSREGTWQAYDPTDRSRPPVNWVKDLLRQKLLLDTNRSARVLFFGYESDYAGTSPVNQSVQNIAKHLVRDLLEKRKVLDASYCFCNGIIR